MIKCFALIGSWISRWILFLYFAFSCITILILWNFIILVFENASFLQNITCWSFSWHAGNLGIRISIYRDFMRKNTSWQRFRMEVLSKRSNWFFKRRKVRLVSQTLKWIKLLLKEIKLTIQRDQDNYTIGHSIQTFIQSHICLLKI